MPEDIIEDFGDVTGRGMMHSEKKSFENGMVYRELTKKGPTPEIVGEDVQTLSLAEKHFKAWSILKDRGFPVVPEKTVVNENTTAETDITLDGTNLYDIVSDGHKLREKKPLDGKFISSNLSQFKAMIAPMLELANNNGVELPGDGCFHIALHPDGKMELVMLNFGLVKIYKNPSDKPESLSEYNEKTVYDWAHAMEAARWKIERSLK